MTTKQKSLTGKLVLCRRNANTVADLLAKMKPPQMTTFSYNLPSFVNDACYNLQMKGLRHSSKLLGGGFQGIVSWMGSSRKLLLTFCVDVNL